jgi:Tfp pilus assembly protein PilN
MLRTNLSTRPFYNERGVHGALAVTALIVAALTIFNLTQIVLLTRRQSSLGSQAAAAETRAAELRAQAARTRQTVDAKLLDSISSAAREANTIIGQRLFSWTVLLNRLGDALPDNVRITALRPDVARDGSVTVAMTVFAESVEEIEQFMANLEESTAFSEVYPIDDEPAEGGGVRASLEGKYAPAP